MKNNFKNFLVFIFICVFMVSLVSFYRYVVLNDFRVFYSENEIPNIYESFKLTFK